jgi:eukaryotic translation initiation factor 2C
VVANFAKGLTEEQAKTMTKDMDGLKVKYTMPVKEGEPPHKRLYRVNGLKKAANKEIIADLGQTVEAYFKERYEVEIKHPNLQLLWVGSKHKTIYVPMEFCQMEKQPMPRKKKLPDDAIAKMIRFTAVKPLDRQKKIIDNLKKHNNKYQDDPYAREFGINVSGEMATLTGRVLDAPSIEYAGGKSSTINKANPGKWFQDKNHYVSAEKVTNWMLLDLASLTSDQQQQVVNGFSGVGKEVGMVFNKNKADILIVKGGMREAEESIYYLEDKFKKAMEHFKSQSKKLDLIIIVFPFKAGFLYGKIKQLCDMKYGIVTQCFLKDNVFKPPTKELNKQTIGNICLKINAKLGGINHVLSAKSKPALLKRPVMVMGADVSHPAPESRGSRPSIAAVVASVEPKAANYQVEVRVQDGAQNEEVIHDMKNVTKNLLMKFHDANKGRKPEKIIMYRDGVSEGQFLAVLASELVAMREACRELEEGYQPQITYIIVQKRHHTRFFPVDNNKYKNGNALAGTVVDMGINHPTEGDFYLLR